MFCKLYTHVKRHCVCVCVCTRAQLMSLFILNYMKAIISLMKENQVRGLAVGEVCRSSKLWICLCLREEKRTGLLLALCGLSTPARRQQPASPHAVQI